MLFSESVILIVRQALVDSLMPSSAFSVSESVAVLPGDNESSLAERVKIEEHALYPRIIDDLASGQIKSP